MLGGTDEKAAGELVKKIEAGKISDGFTIRDIYRNQWHLLDKKEKAEAAVQLLIELNWLRQELKGFTKRQATAIYRINPKKIPKTQGGTN